ncbi:hypothetical protein AHU65_001539 [Salmonella enterica subsp. enterica]|nr:hypothetical protein [Salmonella enterica subsp. enterica serovar Miami]
MVKSLSVMGMTDSDFPMSSITGRANFLLTTSTGGGIQMGVKLTRLVKAGYSYNAYYNLICTFGGYFFRISM